MVKTFNRRHRSDAMNTAFEKFPMKKHPNDVSSGIIFVLGRQQLCENNSARTDPTRSAGSFHSTSWAFVGIARKNFAPNLHQVGDLELSQGLSGLAVAKSGEDALSSGSCCNIFSTLAGSHHRSKSSTITKLGKETAVFFADGVSSAKCPLM